MTWTLFNPSPLLAKENVRLVENFHGGLGWMRVEVVAHEPFLSGPVLEVGSNKILDPNPQVVPDRTKLQPRMAS